MDIECVLGGIVERNTDFLASVKSPINVINVVPTGFPRAFKNPNRVLGVRSGGGLSGRSDKILQLQVSKGKPYCHDIPSRDSSDPSGLSAPLSEKELSLVKGWLLEPMTIYTHSNQESAEGVLTTLLRMIRSSAPQHHHISLDLFRQLLTYRDHIPHDGFVITSQFVAQWFTLASERIFVLAECILNASFGATTRGKTAPLMRTVKDGLFVLHKILWKGDDLFVAESIISELSHPALPIRKSTEETPDDTGEIDFAEITTYFCSGRTAEGLRELGVFGQLMITGLPPLFDIIQQEDTSTTLIVLDLLLTMCASTASAEQLLSTSCRQNSESALFYVDSILAKIIQEEADSVSKGAGTTFVSILSLKLIIFCNQLVRATAIGHTQCISVVLHKALDVINLMVSLLEANQDDESLPPMYAYCWLACWCLCTSVLLAVGVRDIGDDTHIVSLLSSLATKYSSKGGLLLSRMIDMNGDQRKSLDDKAVEILFSGESTLSIFRSCAAVYLNFLPEIRQFEALLESKSLRLRGSQLGELSDTKCTKEYFNCILSGEGGLPMAQKALQSFQFSSIVGLMAQLKYVNDDGSPSDSFSFFEKVGRIFLEVSCTISNDTKRTLDWSRCTPDDISVLLSISEYFHSCPLTVLSSFPSLMQMSLPKKIHAMCFIAIVYTSHFIDAIPTVLSRLGTSSCNSPTIPDLEDFMRILSAEGFSAGIFRFKEPKLVFFGKEEMSTGETQGDITSDDTGKVSDITTWLVLYEILYTSLCLEGHEFTYDHTLLGTSHIVSDIILWRLRQVSLGVAHSDSATCVSDRLVLRIMMMFVRDLSALPESSWNSFADQAQGIASNIGFEPISKPILVSILGIAAKIRIGEVFLQLARFISCDAFLSSHQMACYANCYANSDYIDELLVSIFDHSRYDVCQIWREKEFAQGCWSNQILADIMLIFVLASANPRSKAVLTYIANLKGSKSVSAHPPFLQYHPLVLIHRVVSYQLERKKALGGLEGDVQVLADLANDRGIADFFSF
eukprot:Tbor_TRINITY_DN810_c0_g1::TRINITY_DN810_c0_g1_i1::g.26611::m.26611